jgi:acyl-CoA synthetase (AMP-forming)/AMP-acid ligase II
MELSYAHGSSDVQLIGETIGANLERTVERFPDAEALVARHQGQRFTYRELNEAVDRVARALLAIGLEAGDRLGIWSPNCVEWALVQYATAKTGVVLVNINPAYRTSELQYALNHSGCRVLVAARAFKTSDYAAMIEEVRPNLTTLERTILIDSPDWDELVAGADQVTDDELRERADSLQFDDPINIQYTSGTTGAAKGATLRTTTSSTTASSWPSSAATRRPTASASPCRSTTASEWSWATSAARHTAPAWCCPPPRSSRARCSRRSRRSAARASMACRRCSSPSSAIRTSRSTTCRACAPASWPARRARSR